MTYTILHNPQCSKSRKALELLNTRGVQVEVVEYLKTSLSEEELRKLISILDASPASLVRQGEKRFQETPFDLKSESEIAKHLAEHPELIERPIVIREDRAIIARPPEKVLDF